MSKSEETLRGNVRRLGFGNAPPMPHLDSEYPWRLKTEAMSSSADVCNTAWGWEETESVSTIVVNYFF